jgi:hypothetical protein
MSAVARRFGCSMAITGALGRTRMEMRSVASRCVDTGR